MARSLKVVFYAVNGGGVGHLTRMLAIARWVRRYASFAGYRPEIVFLTSSEADGALFHERFASFKVPSKTAAAEGGLDKASYLALAKQWVWHSIALLRPDLLVVDTFPRGSFGELGACLDLCKKKAFVFRPVKSDFAERQDFQSVLPFYDSIVVPELDASVSVPAAVRPRLRAVGPVTAREPVELLERDDARGRLAIPREAFVVLATAGGGGDPGARDDLEAITVAFRDAPDTYVVVAAGPLFRGPGIHGDRVRFLSGLGAAELARAADVAVSGAGYNSFHELMLAGVPTVFVPQDKVADEQAARAERARAVGAATLLERPLTPESVRRAVEPFRDPERRAEAGAAARALVPASGARRAARELLRLVLPVSEVDAAEAGYGDAILVASRRLAIEESVFVDAIAALDAGPDDVAPFDPAGASRAAVELIEGAAALGVPADAALRVAGTFLRRIETGSCADRARASLSVIRALAPFSDWAGAAAFLRLVAPDPFASPAGFAADVTAIAAELTSAGDDLYRGIQRVVAGGKLGGPRAEVVREGEGAQ